MRQLEKEITRLIPREQTPNEDRLVMLCDGIFAIALTLLVLDIGIKDIPQNLSQAAFQKAIDSGLQGMIPPTVSYLVTFVVIAMYWRFHRNLMQVVQRLDNFFISLTFLFLAFITFFPVTSRLLGNYGDAQEVIIFYTLGLSGCGFSAWALWFYATWHHRLVDPALSNEIIYTRTYYLLLNPLVYCASLLLLPLVPAPYYICFSWVLIGFTHKIIQGIYQRWFKKPVHDLLHTMHDHEQPPSDPAAPPQTPGELPSTPLPGAQQPAGKEKVEEQ